MWKRREHCKWECPAFWRPRAGRGCQDSSPVTTWAVFILPLCIRRLLCPVVPVTPWYSLTKQRSLTGPSPTCYHCGSPRACLPGLGPSCITLLRSCSSTNLVPPLLSQVSGSPWSCLELRPPDPLHTVLCCQAGLMEGWLTHLVNEYLLWVRFCSQCWGYSSESSEPKSLPLWSLCSSKANRQQEHCSCKCTAKQG